MSEDTIRPWQLPVDLSGPNLLIEVTDKDCVALADFTYDGDELPVFEVGDKLLLKQGGEAFFIWDLGHNVIFRTENTQWLFHYLAFDFKLIDKKEMKPWVNKSLTGWIYDGTDR